MACLDNNYITEIMKLSKEITELREALQEAVENNEKRPVMYKTVMNKAYEIMGIVPTWIK